MMKKPQKFKVLSAKKQRKGEHAVRVIFPGPLFERMQSAFLEAEAVSRECYAIALCGLKTDGSRKSWTYMVRSLHVPRKEDLFEQSSITVTPGADFMERVLSDAAEHNSAVLEIHTHVGSPEPNFSWVDIENGIENGRFLKSCGMRFAMAVVGSKGFSLGEYESDHDSIQMPTSACISLMGRAGIKDAMFHKSPGKNAPPDVRNSIESVRVAIVGLDGVGANIAHMLAHVGVRKFTLYESRLVDDDRLPYALAKDKGKRRTKVLYSSLKKIAKGLDVEQVCQSFSLARGSLKDCDVVFGCADGHEERLAMNDMSLRYFIPLIDISASGSSGEVRVIMPSITGCLGCLCEVSGNCQDGSTLAADGVIASMAVQEFLDLMKGDMKKDFDSIRYRPIGQQITRSAVERDEMCPLCGEGGVLGAGDVRKARK